MVVPNNLFLFFFCNWQGQAYYLDSSNNVALGNITGTDYSLPDAPAGWLEQELAWGRNEKYYGFNRSYSQDLKFVRKSATILRTLYYQGYGIESQVYFVATKWNNENGIYELYYKGEIDFTQITEDDPTIGFTVKTLEAGALKVFKAYENTIFEIPIDGTLHQHKLLQINGLTFYSKFTYKIVPFAIKANGTVIPCIQTQQDGNDVGIEKGSQDYREFDYTSTGSIDDNVLKSGNYIFKTINAISSFKVVGSLYFNGTTSGKLYFIKNDGSTITINEGTFTGTYTLNETLSLSAGDALFLCFACYGDYTGMTGGEFYLYFESQYEDTYSYVISPGDLFDLLIQKIIDISSDTDHKYSFGIEHTLLDGYANLCLTSGAALRGLSSAVIKISLAQFFEIYNPILCASMGTKRESNESETFFFESRAKVFDNSNIDVELGEVSHLKIIPATSMLCSDIKIGWPEQKYDNKQGNDEFNTTSKYKTPLRKLSKEIDLVAKARADAFGIEYARFLTGSTNVSNNKSDNDIFIINIDLSSPSSNTGAIVSGNIAKTIITSINYRNIVAGISSCALLKYPAIWTDIQGSTLKNNFTLVDLNINLPSNTTNKQFSNAAIQMSTTGVSLNISGSVTIAGIAQGIICPANNYNIESIGTVTLKFILYKNNFIEVAHSDVSFTFGYEGNFKTIISFTNITANFGDKFYVLWRFKDGLNWIPGNITNQYFVNGVEVVPYGIVGDYTQLSFNITSSDVIPTYSLLRKTYSSVGPATMIQTQNLYNIEDLTPARMIKKHGAWFRSMFSGIVDKNLSFQASDKNQQLSIQYTDGTVITENADIPISDLNQNILFYPFYLQFDTQIPQTFIEIMNYAQNAHIHFTYYGIDFYGYPVDIKQRPALNESQTWKLLASPSNNLANFVKLDISGISLLNLDKMSTFISHYSPVKFYSQQEIINDPRYNFVHMDSNWFVNQIDFWVNKPNNYYQKWQQNDTINLQIISNAISPAKVKIYNDSQELVKTVTMESVINSAVNSPLILFQTSISLATLDEGIYFMVIEVGIDGAMDSFISEGIYVKESWPLTLLFEYSNSFNIQKGIFTSNWNPSFRVEGWLDSYVPKSHTSSFEDQPADIKILNSINYGTHKLNIGTQKGIPPYAIRLVNYIMGLDTVLIDGLAFSKNSEDTEWETAKSEGWPMGYYSLEVRESVNTGGVVSNTSGTIDNNLVVGYMVNMKGFGEAGSGDNVVIINKVE